MTFIPSGKFRQRVTLQQAVRTPDGGGGAAVTWSPVADLWASIEPMSADERFDSDRLQGRVTHQIWLRYRAGVTPAMRFLSGARVFDIRSAVDADEVHRYLRCLVEETVL